jgi:acetolactate synthase-1/2/3 large subunit
MTGARVLLKCLRREGVNTIFGYPGGAALPIYDALPDVPGIRHILVRHEQGAAHAADAYARASGNVGVCLATSGPGATNLVTGIAAAMADSVPMVVITAQVPSPLMGTDAFQEIDTLGITLPITKHSALVTSPQEIPRLVREAFAVAKSGRPGPVLLDIPKDVSAARLSEFPDDTSALPSPEVKADLVGLSEAARLLTAAKRPVLYVGGGTARSGAAPLVRELARRLQIPVTTTLMALGVFPTDDELFLGMPGMHGSRRANCALSEADVLLAVGARFDDRVTGNAARFSPQSRRIHLDIDAAEMGKLCRADLQLVGDARALLSTLLRELDRHGKPETAGWLARLREQPRQPPVMGELPGASVSPRALFDTLNDLLPRDALIVTDVGQHQMWAAQLLRFSTPGQFITSGGLGAMGFGVPAAMGAKLACPERTVVAIVGDGGFQMTCHELSTMARYNVPAVVIVLDNQCLGMVRQWQQLFHGGRYSEVDLSDNPDFAALSRALGVAAESVQEEAQLRPALQRALHKGAPCVVHVKVRRTQNVFPIVPPGEPATVMLESEKVLA